MEKIVKTAPRIVKNVMIIQDATFVKAATCYKTLSASKHVTKDTKIKVEFANHYQFQLPELTRMVIFLI